MEWHDKVYREGGLETGQTGKGAEVRTGVHHVVGSFFAGLLHFYWTLASRRGALEKGME